MFVKKDKDIYRVVEAGGWVGCEPVTLTEVTQPVNRWTGGKRTIAQHQQVTAFFEWTQKEYKSEAVIHWLYNEETRLWCPIALPQRGVGMTVSLLEDHENWVPSFERGNRGDVMGTDHHHCSSSAFQSGTDHNDEKTKEGLHLTIGGVGTGKYSLHARSSFRKNILPAVLSDWYEVPEQYAGLPDDLQSAILTHLLTQPTPDVEFPEWWKANVVRWQQTSMTSHGGYTPPSNNHYNRGYQQSLFMDLKEEYIESRKMTWEQVEAFLVWIEEQEGLVELMDIMVDQHDHFQRVVNIVGWQAEAEQRDRPRNLLVEDGGEPTDHYATLSDYGLMD